jgi:SAM-dependent methyltransferase
MLKARSTEAIAASPFAEGRSRNGIKANFDDVYVAADPRPYFQVLHGLDYIIPEVARPVFEQVVVELERLRGRPLRVLDLGCSYGINAALLQFPIDLDRLARRYAGLSSPNIGPAQLTMLDRHYFRSWPRRSIEVIGLDASGPAIEYGLASGLLHHGIVGNFESQPLSSKAQELLRGVDLVISTGAFGYLTERTLAKVLRAIGQPAPWLAMFVLRMFPYDAAAATLASCGLVTETLRGMTFVQRRFQSESEFREILTRLDELGIDPEGLESEGLLHAGFHLSRSEFEAASRPLADLITLRQDGGHAFGRRYKSIDGGNIDLVR